VTVSVALRRAGAESYSRTPGPNVGGAPVCHSRPLGRADRPCRSGLRL